MAIITLGFLNIDYLFKILCTDDNFYHVPCIGTKFFSNVKQAEKYAAKFDIKNLKILQIDEFNNIKTLKFIN
jgi:hypothetical protein